MSPYNKNYYVYNSLLAYGEFIRDLSVEIVILFVYVAL